MLPKYNSHLKQTNLLNIKHIQDECSAVVLYVTGWMGVSAWRELYRAPYEYHEYQNTVKYDQLPKQGGLVISAW